jgi:hypothetical protein
MLNLRICRREVAHVIAVVFRDATLWRETVQSPSNVELRPLTVVANALEKS